MAKKKVAGRNREGEHVFIKLTTDTLHSAETSAKIAEESVGMLCCK